MTCIHCDAEMTEFEKRIHDCICSDCAIKAARKSAAAREATRRYINSEGK